MLAAVIPQLLLHVLREEAQVASRQVDLGVLVDQEGREVLEARMDPGVVGRSTFDLCPLHAASQPPLCDKVVGSLQQIISNTGSANLSNRPLQQCQRQLSPLCHDRQAVLNCLVTLKLW